MACSNLRAARLAICLLAAAGGATRAFALTCEYLPRVPVGTVHGSAAPYLTEASGLVQSRRSPEVFWSHNDNGGDRRIFALRMDGTYLGTWSLVGSTHDNEDIALGPGPIAGESYVYLGDVGHNWGIWGCTIAGSSTGSCAGCAGSDCRERDLHVLRAVEPAVDPGQPFVQVANYPAETITLRFPDAEMLGQRQDVETILVDPQNGDLYVVTKRSTPAMAFRAAFPQSTAGPITMQWVADLPWGGDNQATGGDISSDGRLIAIRRYSDAFLWERAPGASIGDALTGSYCHRIGLSEGQGEAIALDVDDSGTFYTLSEGAGDVPLYRFAVVGGPRCSSHAECDDGVFCNGAEVCDPAEGCGAGTPPCTGLSCVEPTRQCVQCVSDENCDDYDVCTLDRCAGGACVSVATDTDGDGATDCQDNCPGAPNPDQVDRDGDFIGDPCDVCPLDGVYDDADRDWVCAAAAFNPPATGGNDNCPSIENPDQDDGDGDGVGTVCDPCPTDPLNDPDLDTVCNSTDNCPNEPNPTQANRDGDAQGDVCDPDNDNDGVADASDNCPLVENAAQQNADGDGLGDVCDSCPSDPTNDLDSDGLCGLTDNCPSVANPDQTNTDLDDFGDACDACAVDPLNDIDGDGRCGEVDNCVVTPNPSQRDSDGDAVGDACDPCSLDARNDYDGDGRCGDADNCPSIVNADQADGDADGLGDACDCDPSNPANPSRPGEVGALIYADKQMFAWDPAVPNAAAFAVTRGRLEVRPFGNGLVGEVCSGSIGAPVFSDPSNPEPGRGYWYLASALNSCGTGGWGHAARRGVPIGARTPITCP